MRSDGTASENRKHVPDAIGVLRVLLQYVEEARVVSGVEDAFHGVVSEHSFVPEDVNATGVHRRSRRRRQAWDVGGHRCLGGVNGLGRTRVL